MWISAKTVVAERATWQSLAGQYQMELAMARKELQMLTARVVEQRTEANWLKHRLTQVERERGQLIQAALGVKVAVPEFVPTYEDPGAALNEMPNLSTVGGDAPEDFTPGDATTGEDYSRMPGYRRNE